MLLVDVLKRCEGTAEFLDVPITDVNQRGISGDSPLHVVAGWGDLHGVELLLAANAQVNMPGDLSRTPIFAAISGGHLAVVRRLVEAGALLTLTDEFGMTPLRCAELAGHKEIIEELRNDEQGESAPNP